LVENYFSFFFLKIECLADFVAGLQLTKIEETNHLKQLDKTKRS